MNEVSGSQIASVPMTLTVQQADTNFVTFMISIALVFYHCDSHH